MKIYTTRPRYHWYSPYNFLKTIVFWREIDRDDPTIQKLVKILNPVSRFIMKFLDIVHPEIKYIKIENHDVWSMDSTLSPIILSMLKVLNKGKHGAPFVDDEDVPAGIGLRSTEAPPKESEYDTDANHFKRWDWVMNELIWTFEQLQPECDWKSQYSSGKVDFLHTPIDAAGNVVEKKDATMYRMDKGPNYTYVCDYDAVTLHQKRINNGLLLFGKHFQNLWD